VPALESQPVETLKGIGAATRERMGKLGIATLFDLLVHIPLRYEDRTRITPLSALVPFSRTLIDARIAGVELSRGRRRALLCRLDDGTGVLHMRMFHYNGAQLARFTPGTRIQCFGEVRAGSVGLEMIHPEYRFPAMDEPTPAGGRLTPVYPVGEGLRQRTLQNLIEQTFQRLEAGAAVLHDPLEVRPGPTPTHPLLSEALRLLHRPLPDEEPQMAAARERLAFEELLAHRLGMLRRRAEGRRQASPVLTLDECTRQAFASGRT
jgi:ATP-dependent DNA helicase RecG